jgi:glycosyltransferase involved in cell wall biosynthesis
LVDGSTGFLVPGRNVEILAARIIELLRDPDLRGRMGAAGLARARERFTVERMVEQIAAVYARLDDRRREADTASPSVPD